MARWCVRGDAGLGLLRRVDAPGRTINAALSIQGPGAAMLTIDGGGSSEAILVTASNVTIAGVTVTNAAVGIHVANGGPVFTQALAVTGNTTDFVPAFP